MFSDQKWNKWKHKKKKGKPLYISFRIMMTKQRNINFQNKIQNLFEKDFHDLRINNTKYPCYYSWTIIHFWLVFFTSLSKIYFYSEYELEYYLEFFSRWHFLNFAAFHWNHSNHQSTTISRHQGEKLKIISQHLRDEI